MRIDREINSKYGQYGVTAIMVDEYSESDHVKLTIRKGDDKYNISEKLAQAKAAVEEYNDKIESIRIDIPLGFIDPETFGLKELFQAIKNASTIGVLDLSATYLGRARDPGIFNIILDTCDGEGVREVHLGGYGRIPGKSLDQENKELEFIAEVATKVEKLSVGVKGFVDDEDDEDAKARISKLFKALAVSTKLKELNVGHSFLDVDLISSLFSTSKKWERISGILKIGWIDEEEMEPFLRMIDEGCVAISFSKMLLQMYTNEQRLNCLQLSKDVVDILSDWLARTPLREVDLSNNGLSEKNTQKLADAIRSNPGELKVNLSLNKNHEYRLICANGRNRSESEPPSEASSVGHQSSVETQTEMMTPGYNSIPH